MMQCYDSNYYGSNLIKGRGALGDDDYGDEQMADQQAYINCLNMKPARDDDSENGGQSGQRVKKDALWKPLLRGFRIYLRRSLQNYLDIN